MSTIFGHYRVTEFVEMWFLRRILRISYFDRTMSDDMQRRI